MQKSAAEIYQVDEFEMDAVTRVLEFESDIHLRVRDGMVPDFMLLLKELSHSVARSFRGGVPLRHGVEHLKSHFNRAW